MERTSLAVVHQDGQRLFVEALAAALTGGRIEVVWRGGEGSIEADDGLPGPLLSADVALVLSDCAEKVLAEVTGRRREAGRPTIILALGHERRVLREAREAGAGAYVTAEMGLETFTDTLHLVSLGVEVFPAMDMPYGDTPSCRRAAGEARHGGPNGLSERELEVVAAVGEGLSNKQIARVLDITESTVKTHLKAILRKTGTANRTQAAIWAISKGLAAAVPGA